MIGMTKELIDVTGGKYRTTALMNAAWKGHVKIVELLLKHGADVEVRDGDGWEAIHWAASEGHLDVAKLTAKKHPKAVNARTDRWQTPLYWARDRKHSHIVNWLINEMKITE